ncbi:dTMP kinase [Legionella shakespearei]|uniref:Thymidylate kinase n=1 Tax=Legionella shakespearei DSM 23087 TaxID=1122169 RepID=A0A0W0YX58_9GAMM|nr:dTMP kinase [Legionella shakespearei]KTD61473.1 thymidylate kinase [Legionella shakespearei DSM 23087]
MSAGKLIVIEGLEGAGKSTAVHTLMTLLEQRAIPHITVREPGGTAIGELLRSIIKNPDYSGIIEDKTELLLLYAARMQLLAEVIKPALKRGEWVIADRFELSTLAYQGGGRGIDLSMINHLSSFCLDGFKPDLTLFLDITPESGMQRALLRGKLDRIEQQSIDFFHRVYETYMSYIDEHSDVVKINATQPLDEVQKDIQNTVIAFIESKR